MTILYLYKKALNELKRSGRKVINSQWPSSGGIGIRLKIAKTRFKTIINTISSWIIEENTNAGKILIISPNKTANVILEAGPANAILAGPYFLSLSKSGL